MDGAVQEKVKKILRGEVRYSSANLAFNMLISKLKNRVKEDPSAMDSCLEDMEDFLKKYPIVAKVDLANIAAL